MNKETFDTLYSRTSTGAVQTWKVEVEGNKYRTVHGQLDGKLQTTEWTICEVTNEGRANERSNEEQALFEAQAMWKKKQDTGYFTDVAKIDTKVYIKPMLAKKWEDRKDKIEYPVFCQPKLDGLRAVISKKGAYTRNGKKWVTIPHILEGLEPIFDEFPDIVFDGELYNHNLKHDFNKITSLVKKQKPSEDDLMETTGMVQFWCYDLAVPEQDFQKRSMSIEQFVKDYNLEDYGIRAVPTYQANDESELDDWYGTWMDEGYEGQMIRENSLYEFKRSNALLKRKEFEDAEYKIVDVIEGKGNKSEMAGAMVFVNELGHEFNSNIKGDREYLKKIWDNKQDYIGQIATVRYFNLTPDKLIPRFPYVYGVRFDA